MGRQINFYIDRQTELEILDFIKREGGKFMFNRGVEIVFSNDFDKFRSAQNGWLKCHFTKDGFAPPKIERVFNKHMGREFDHCSVSRGEIIEFDGGVVNLPDKKARSGRVYMMSDYYDEAGELVKKGENFIKFYEKLVRFIKKLAPRREVKAGGYTFKIYVSDRVFELYRGGEIVKFY
jgi:hypothetical protein